MRGDYGEGAAEARYQAGLARGQRLDDWLADHDGPACPEHGRAAMVETTAGWQAPAGGEPCGYAIDEDGLREQLEETP